MTTTQQDKKKEFDDDDCDSDGLPRLFEPPDEAEAARLLQTAGSGSAQPASEGSHRGPASAYAGTGTESTETLAYTVDGILAKDGNLIDMLDEIAEISQELEGVFSPPLGPPTVTSGHAPAPPAPLQWDANFP